MDQLLSLLDLLESVGPALDETGALGNPGFSTVS